MKPQHLTPDETAKLYAKPDLRVVGEVPEPSIVTQKRDQLTRALDRLDLDTSAEPDLTYPDLVAITGPLLPGQLWVVYARPEMGKTTLAHNLGRRWLSRGLGWAYFGTEEATETTQNRFAAMLAGHPPSAVVAGEWHTLPQGAIADVQRELYNLNFGPYKDLAFFVDCQRPALKDVRLVAEEAVEMGLRVVILDHFHRMALPESHQETATMAETVRRIKQIAVDLDIRILMFAQARRAGERSIARFQPPTAESGKGTSALEEEADVLLGLFKPLGRIDPASPEMDPRYRPVSRKDEQAFERGEIETGDILIPHSMGLKVLKHRRNGDLSGKITKLHCQNGMLVPGLLR